MTLLDECKDEVARHHGKADWFYLNEDLSTRLMIDPHLFAEACTLYMHKVLDEVQRNGYIFYFGADQYSESMRKTLTDIGEELVRAKQFHPEYFVNQHEAYAVILEEVDELWAEIKKNHSQYDIPAQRKEAIQAAAMLVRLCVELLNNHP